MNTTTLVHDPAILGQLPEGTEIRDADGDIGTKVGDGFAVAGWRLPQDPAWFSMPATVLSPSPATAQLVADLAGPLNLHEVLTELRAVLDQATDMFERQDTVIEVAGAADGGLPQVRTARLALVEALFERDRAKMLGEVLATLEKLTGRRGGP